MGFKYTPDDLKRWLRADPATGPQWAFILDKMAKLGHIVTTEWLVGRNFDATDDGRAVVGTGARDQLQACAWATDALREWAGIGCTSEKTYFMTVARQWAREGPGKGHTAKCLGSTLDFLTLVSDAGSMKPSLDMLAGRSKVFRDVANIFCWVFTDRIQAFENKAVTAAAPINSGKLGQKPKGLNDKFCNTDAAGNPAGDVDEDQTHHFAGFFHFGASVGVGERRLNMALANTGDWDDEKGVVINKGDCDLGKVAARWGNSFAERPRFIGKEVEAELT